MMSGRMPSAVNARLPARLSAVMMPYLSISAAVAEPVAHARPHSFATGTIASLRFGVINFESANPSGTAPIDASIATTPMVTGPAIAPRPTSSIPAMMRAPVAISSRS